MANFRELLATTKAQIREITPQKAEQALGQAPFLDVREADEHDQGTIPDSVFVPRGHLEGQIEGKVPDKGRPLVVYCAGGARSAFAVKTLADLGYTDVVSMAGGFNQWKNEGRDWIGERKVDSAKKTLTALNPDVNVVTYAVRLGADNVLDIIDGYDLIVDGTDNFPTRYLVNDAALLKRIPVVHGSIFRFEGQATVFAPYEGPCYRCLIPEPPPPELAPSCAEAGVLGVLPGIVGSIQAIEAIKVLLDLGDPLIGRLLAYDSLEQSFRTFKVNRDPNCPACGPEAKEIVIAEYDELCLPHAVLADGSTVGH